MSTADIRAIEFETETGSIRFTVKGKRFQFRCDAHDNPASSVAAAFAMLAELRRVSTVTLRVWFGSELQDPVYDVDRITFRYDTLKP